MGADLLVIDGFTFRKEKVINEKKYMEMYGIQKIQMHGEMPHNGWSHHETTVGS